jgi:MFS transporter, ACS family, D-galactonate transporter
VRVARASRKVSIALVVACQSTQALAFGGIALFLPLIRTDVEMTFSQAGSLAVSSTLVYAFMQIPAGYLADRYGAKRLFVIGLLGTNAMALAFALLQDYGLMLANQAVSGFFRSLMFAPGLLVISGYFPSERRATAMGLYVAGGFSSSILLSTIGPLLVEPLGWRLVFALFAGMGLVFVLAFWRFGQPGPPVATGTSRMRVADLVALLRHRVLLLAGVVQFVRLALVHGIQYWLPTFIVLDKGYSLQIAGLVVAMSAAVTAPSNFLGGYVSDRLGRPLLVIATSLSVLAATCVLLVAVDSLPAILAVVAVQAVFIQVYFGPLFAVPVAFLGERGAGTVNGISNFFANLGGLTFAYTLGAVKDLTGSFTIGFYSLAAACGVALVATALLARIGPPEPTEPARTGG